MQIGDNLSPSKHKDNNNKGEIIMSVQVRVPITFYANLEIDTDDIEEAKREMIEVIKANEGSLLEMCEDEYTINEDKIEVSDVL